MEEWHQKLHNNTSPDDVIICQALLAYLQHDLDVSFYWQTLQVALPTCARLCFASNASWYASMCDASCRSQQVMNNCHQCYVSVMPVALSCIYATYEDGHMQVGTFCD